MAERTRNVWNDDDGEEEKKPKKHRKLKAFFLFLLVLVVVLGVVLVAAYRDGTGFDVLRRYFNYGKVEEVGGEVIYDYDASVRNRFAALENRLVVLSDTKLSILSPDGGEVWSETVNMTNPTLCAGGGRVAAYDIGGTELYVVDQQGALLHLTTDEEEPFIAATLNHDGWLAVTAEKKGRKGSVAVYDEEMELVFELYSGNRFVTDAYVTDDDRYLAVVTLGQEENVFVSNMVLYDLTQEEPVADYSIKDGLVVDIAQQDDRLVTVSDTCLTFAGTDGTDLATYPYDGLHLRAYDLEGSGFAALLLNRYQSGSVGQLVTVAPDGTTLASLDVTREVLDISAAGRYLAVLYTDSLVVYNPNLQVYASLSGTDFATGVLLRTDGSALQLSSESAGLFLP